jgi:leucyl-tRNA synthetase
MYYFHMSYDFKTTEKKWQEKWEKDEVNRAKDFSEKPKKYFLVEFPYPSGDGLHVGHCRSYTALDILARKSRMDGYNVLYPMGWDAFGLPTENYAIKTGKHPREITKRNTDNFRRQMKSLGFSFDWSREINTTNPEYYKWTQWIFLQFFKKGLAYKTKMSINWCPKDKIGLANEEVIDGKCERCGTEVQKKEMEQWMLKITAYADKLIDGLEEVNYPDRVRDSQINWIGRSEGAEIKFAITNYELRIKVFTTRVDTVFGVSAVVLAPEYELITNEELRITNREEVEAYVAAVKNKSDLERTEEKEKTGVELKGVRAINPFTGEEVAIWVADYVLGGYGTGAVMMVPAHDERDFAFAKKYDLPVKEVITVGGASAEDLQEAFIDDGVLINSGEFSGLTSGEARKKMTEWLVQNDSGEKKINYHLRDWVFSRQHYWGEPIPIIYCDKCGTVPVNDVDLPVTLPEVERYEPTDNGESPLANISEWVNIVCPKCNGAARRETDTMPNWAGSSWYYFRYADPKNTATFADKALLRYWLPVDIYNGGMEHTTLHLLYSRFWHKFLYDEGLVPTPEPYKRRTSHGMILGEGGIKMSKSRGNVVNPDDVVKEYGADVLRVYEMFMGPFSDAIPWEPKSIIGAARFLEKIWNLYQESNQAKKQENNKTAEKLLHKTIKGVTEDIDNFKFNTAISKMMILINEIGADSSILQRETGKDLAKILAPFAPHLAEEIWEKMGNKKSIFNEPWPKYDPALARDVDLELVVQVNGKVRDKITVAAGISEEDAKAAALGSEKIRQWLAGKEPRKMIFTGKLISIVV